MLEQTYLLQEKATSLDNSNPAYLAELGYELLLQARVRDALRCYQNASKLDETSITALTGACCLDDDSSLASVTDRCHPSLTRAIPILSSPFAYPNLLFLSFVSDYLILFLPTYSLAIHHLWH